jgi:hypothetical protein
MEGVRSAAILVLAFVAGCGGCSESEDKPVEPADKPVEAVGPKVDWRTTNYGHLRLAIPRSWTNEPQLIGNQVLFFSPVERMGFRQNLMAYWLKKKMDIEGWASLNRGKFDDSRSAYTVHEQGWTKIGGQRAYFIVHEHEEGDPDRGKSPFVSIDWYFVYDGHAGFLRGNSRKELFKEDRPLYEASAALLRFGPVK